MTDKTNKSEGPACACGRVDIYKEMLKNENKEKEGLDSSDSENVEDDSDSADKDEK